VTNTTGSRAARHSRRLAWAAAGLLGLAACAGPGGSPDTADSATCDHGFLCGSYVDGDGDGNVSPGEWDQAFRAADTDGDGQLSQGEFERGGGNWGGGGRGGR
jgi:EF hand